jgi:hypothetical protein
MKCEVCGKELEDCQSNANTNKDEERLWPAHGNALRTETYRPSE